jgi:hypothetical protein
MSSEERLHILRMIESGQVTAEEGARLIEAIGPPPQQRPMISQPPRSVRVRVTDLSTRRNKINVTIPVGLINVGLKLGARFAPQDSTAVEDILRAIERGATGRVFEMQDLEEGEQIEIFVE